jgi:thioesterase domain-containing protein/acyl carrier protein
VFWHDWVVHLDGGESEIPDSVKMVAVGGEKICIEHYRRWLPHTAGRNGSWVNAYGPTEATVNATLFDVPFTDNNGTRHDMPIGRPLGNTRIHILDTYLNPVPVGVPGELHIGGSGVARGYLGRPDLTAEKFVPDPFTNTHGAHLYKSGDLARFLHDGTVEYLGRIDNQVKIRGFRIELGEIESALAAHPDIHEAVVTVRDGGSSKRLIAYFTHNGQADITVLRAHLAARLPDYMLPSAYVPLEKLPLSPNGKINRHALPAPSESALVTGVAEEPQGKVEETLARIWRELLKLERVGRHDNFFELGGHSLLAVRMTARIREAFGQALPLSQLFQSPSVAQLAAAINVRQAAGELVVPMNTGKPGNVPIWLIHPGGGTVFCYRQLVEHFPSEHPVYAIQSPEIAGLDASGLNFDGLCQRYMAEILRVQTDGPICLAGWSMGGAIAFRIAELLERAGHSVGWVGVFDTVLHEKIKPLDFEEFVIWAFTRTHAGAWSADATLDAGRKRVTAYVAQHGTEHFRQRLSTDPQWLENELLPDSDCLAFVQQQYEIMRSHSTLMAEFVPGQIDAPLHVFMAQASVESEETETDWMFHTRHAGESTVRTLPGNHENVILLAPNIDEIVRTLTHAMQAETVSTVMPG